MNNGVTFIDANSLPEFQGQQRKAGPKKKQKDFLTDQISTGGGIGGALAGGAAGAALGSVVPGVGTAVGGILGALIGGGAGSGLGELAENKITGEKDLFKNVGQEALIGGATSLPIGAGFKLARAGLKAGTGLGGRAAGELVQEAGVQTLGRRSVAGGKGLLGIEFDGQALNAAQRLGSKTTGIGKQGAKLEDLGSKMLASQGQITGAQARNMGIKPVQAFGNINRRTGLSNLDDMAEFSRAMTGGKDSILDTLTRAAIDGTTGVDVGDLRALTTRLIDDKGKLLSDAQRKSLLSQVQNVGKSVRGGSGGSLSPLANGQEALNSANSFRDAAASIKNSFNAKPEQKQLANIYTSLAKDLEDKIYAAPGVNESIGTLAKAGSDDLFLKAQELRAAGNTKLADAYQKIGQEVFGMKNVKQLRSLKKDFVDIGKIDNATAQAQGARAFNAEDAISTMRGAPIRGALALAGNAATPGVGAAVAGVGRRLAGNGAEAGGKAVGDTLPRLAVRQGAGRLLTADAPQPDQVDFQDASMLDQGMAQQQPEMMQEPSIGGYTKSQLEDGMVKAAAAGDTAAYKQIASIYELLPKQDALELNASTAALAAKQDSAGTALDSLLGVYERAGGGQGKLGGTLANITGGLGLNANAATYNDSTSAAARQVSRALGEVGAGSNADADSYINMLPRLTDTREQAAMKVARLKQLLADSRANTLRYGAGATSDLSSYQQ